MLKPPECDRVCVVLVEVRNPLNIGAAARAMSNFGFGSLRVVKPYEAAFRGARSAVGASSVMAAAAEFGSVAEAVADCSLVVGTTAAGPRRQLQHVLHPLPAAAALLRAHIAAEGRAAILFGSEKRGLSNHDLSHCDFLLHIPTQEEQPSMNLGQAVAVTLYELSRAEAIPVSPSAELATAEERERLTGMLMDALRRSGYLGGPVSASLLQGEEEKVRRLVRRLSLQAADARKLTGMLRQILWKLGQDK